MVVAVVVASLNNKGEGWQSIDSQRAVAGCQINNQHSESLLSLVLILATCVKEQTLSVGVKPLPEANETVASTCPGEVAFYEATFQAGLRLPIHPTIRRILAHYNICPQLAPNALFNNPKSNSGWLYFKARPRKTLLGGYPCNVKGWKKKFFFISRDNWEFTHRLSRDLRVLRVSRSWSTPDKRCNVSPIFIEIGQERFDQISSTLEQGQLYLIKGVLRSKSFLRSFGLDSKRMAYNGMDNAKEKSAGDATHVVINEAISKKVDMKKFTQMAKGRGEPMGSTSSAKGIISGEKHPRDKTPNILPSKKGK
ncbi:hypothetical protein Acr_00g0100020 [Actinidia rufa]|uniref:Uncharacterized protein n=1 Tax=Actinidia rufa TaxID=165716 RepID=A0A7J0E239_9ERIC|nr:hypothetical protein Acr_00g0100020 [Actinidia rufa]